MTTTFLIRGNQENNEGNPIPKAKLTRGQQWGAQAQRYAAWKHYVQEAYVAKLRHDLAIDEWNEADRNLYKHGKPVAADNARMDLMIYWGSEHHGDPENIFGAIADALFINDKHLAGSFDFTHTPEKKGRVEVKITTA